MWYWFMSALQYNSINNHQYVHDLYHPFMVSCWGWFTIAVLVLCNLLNYQPPYFTRNAWWIVYPTLEADAIGITTLTPIQFGHFSVFIHIYIIYIYIQFTIIQSHTSILWGVARTPEKSSFNHHQPPIFDGGPYTTAHWQPRPLQQHDFRGAGPARAELGPNSAGDRTWCLVVWMQIESIGGWYSI